MPRDNALQLKNHYIYRRVINHQVDNIINLRHPHVCKQLNFKTLVRSSIHILENEQSGLLNTGLDLGDILFSF